MKTYIDFLKEGVEGYSFREVVDNLDEEQFESAAEAYHDYRIAQYKEQGLILLPKSLTAENGAKGLLSGEFELMVETSGRMRPFFITVPWTTIKDIYKTVVEHFSENKQFYCRKEVNKGIRCNRQCQACVKIDSNE